MSTNPFDSNRLARRSTSRVSAGEPSIWAARNVEWPIPTALSTQQFTRLLKASKQAAISLGMTPPPDPATTTPSKSLRAHDGSGSVTGHLDSSGAGAGDTDSIGGGSAHQQQSPYYTGGLSGFMSRVLNVSHPTGGPSSEPDQRSLGSGMMMQDSEAALLGPSSRPLRPPRQGCVAAANGWIVACLECPTSATSVTTNTASATTSNNSPPLRLVSRWNVRRGHSGSLPDQWIVLPPPVRPSNAKILHVLVDPTASHSIFSASNGECYYIHHSGTSKQPVKLAGFGPNVDGKWPKETLTGIPATALQGSGSGPKSTGGQGMVVQQGLSMGSYVTSIAWDRENGTEGSSKRILMGTSMGEIYEYALISLNSDDKDDAFAMPVLLHKLYSTEAAAAADPSEVGAAVTGLHFERLRTGLLVLAATSGRHKRTRFYTFYSPHNSSFRMVMADQQYASLMELPGSVDFADLRLCGDHFGLLTATGIYYGTIDRSLSSVSNQSSAGSMKMIIDSGILPYATKDDAAAKGSTAAVPISLAVTPHHLITLNEANDVMFLNRVAQKTIQKERLDASSQSAATTTLSLDENPGELMMDIRRPDQVWLRKGRGLIHISSSQEDRDVWKYTLQKCLEMPTRGRTPLSPSSPRRQRLEQERRAALFGSPAEQLSEEEKAVENLFEQAKNLCTNAAQKAVVTAIRGDYQLYNGRAELAAKYLAQCPDTIAPFADTAIRLGLPRLGIDDPQNYNASPRARESLESSNLPLIAYLSDKMRSSTMSGEKMTSTMIGAWLTELFLNERGGRASSSTSVDESTHTSDSDATQKALLARFLNAHVNYMDSKTIMKILTSHDVDAIECATFAAKSGDISTAVNAALSLSSDSAHGVYEALQILDDAPFELAESLYYKHAPVLLALAPSLACESFLGRYSQGLSPLKLLPALIKYEETRTERERIRKAMDSTQTQAEARSQAKKSCTVVDVQSAATLDGFELRVNEETLRAGSFEEDPDAVSKYLEGVIKLGCGSSSLYSYLVSLYTKLDDEEPLYNFLSLYVPTMGAVHEARKRFVRAGVEHDSPQVPLDMSFTLRTVLKSGRHFRSAILLYKGFGMRQEAVELALKVDPSLARELAQESVELEERKRLWLMIAKNAAADPSSRAGKDVVARVVAVLRDCGPDVLSIEDVLPYMPDFASINQIKDEICDALTSYSSKIDHFLKEMSDCEQVCEQLRDEIHRLRSYRMRMRPDARCAYTNKLVLDAKEPFYVFPSGFVALETPLKQEVLPRLSEKQRERVVHIESILSSHQSAEAAEQDKLQTELDGLIAAECPLTGSVMIDSIDKELEDTMELWEIGHN